MALPLQVFADKHQKVKEFLAENGYSALVVTTRANFYMLTGFMLDVEPWERPVAAVFPAQGEPFMVVHRLSTNHLAMASERNTLYVKDYVSYIEHHAYHNRTYTTLQWTELLAVKLREAGIQRGTLAVDGPGTALLPLLKQMPQINFTDVTPFMISMREIKHEEEIKVMRLCASLTDWAQDRYMELVKPGKLCNVVDAECSALIYEEAFRRFPDRQLGIFMLGLSGPASAAPHGNGANIGVKFEKGHGAVNIIVLTLDGLTVENERTFFLGQPSDLQKRAYDAATRASLAAAEQMVAGNPVSRIEETAQAIIENAGFGDNIIHRTGHGMGIDCHEFPADVTFNHRLLKKNEVWSCEPAIFLYGVGGFRQDNSVVVHETHAEIMTKRSVELKDQIIPV